MDRVLINGEWFEPVAPLSLYEAEFEERLLAHGSTLFPSWVLVPFKRVVHAPESGIGPKCADLALIDVHYREWWVVEVELASHSLEDHVEPQISVLSQGSYDKNHADTIYKTSPGSFDRIRLHRLVTATQPRVLVIVNDFVPKWGAALAQYGAHICVVKPYRDRLSRAGYGISGSVPTITRPLVTFCRRADPMPKALLLQNSAAINAKPGTVVHLTTVTGITSWTFAPLGGNVFLIAVGRYPLDDATKNFAIYRRDDGGLHLEPAPNRIRRRDG